MIFSLDTAKDKKAVSLAGALKNVYALLSGILYGEKFCENTRSSFLPRDLQSCIFLLVIFQKKNHQRRKTSASSPFSRLYAYSSLYEFP